MNVQDLLKETSSWKEGNVPATCCTARQIILNLLLHIASLLAQITFQSHTHTHTVLDTHVPYKSLTPCVPCVRVSVRFALLGSVSLMETIRASITVSTGPGTYNMRISLWGWACTENYKHISIVPLRKLWQMKSSCKQMFVITTRCLPPGRVE